MSAESQWASTKPKKPDGVEDIRKTGILLKKGMGTIYRPWTIRKFTLSAYATLRYYDNESGSLLGELDLTSASVMPLSSDQADGKNFSFMISGLNANNKKKSPLILSAQSQEEADSWVTSLTKYINDPGSPEETAEEAIKKPSAAQAQRKSIMGRIFGSKSSQEKAAVDPQGQSDIAPTPVGANEDYQSKEVGSGDGDDHVEDNNGETPERDQDEECDDEEGYDDNDDTYEDDYEGGEWMSDSGEETGEGDEGNEGTARSPLISARKKKKKKKHAKKAVIKPKTTHSETDGCPCATCGTVIYEGV